MMSESTSVVKLPRVAIQFCTQCKWNLRAAYFAQELLQTFGDSLGEVALQPVTGGIFIITMTHAAPTGEPGVASSGVPTTNTVLWDRKVDGGFPETKELKNRVRNIVDPGRDLGHIDRGLKKAKAQAHDDIQPTVASGQPDANVEHEHDDGKSCEDCKQ